MILRKTRTGGVRVFEAQLIERADLELGVGTVDVFEIAHLLGEFQAFAQVAERFLGSRLAIAQRFVHGFTPSAAAAAHKATLPEFRSGVADAR